MMNRTYMNCLIYMGEGMRVVLCLIHIIRGAWRNKSNEQHRYGAGGGSVDVAKCFSSRSR